MERGVGRKASFNRLSFADEYDDGWNDNDGDHGMHCFHDNDGCDCGCDCDEQPELAINPKIASAKYLASRSRQKKGPTAPTSARTARHDKGKGKVSHPATSSSSSSSSSSARAQAGGGSSTLNVVRPTHTYLRYYDRDPGARLLSVLDPSVLLHVASYLDLRSIAGWSCTGRLGDEFLSPEALYCTAAAAPPSAGSSSNTPTCARTWTCKNDRDADALMLPCAKQLPYRLSLAAAPIGGGGSGGGGGGGKSRPKGLARTMAHEADRIFGNGGVRNLAVAGHVRCKDEVDSAHLFDRGAIAIVTKACEVEVHWIGGNGTNTTCTSTRAGRGKATKSSLKLPGCDLLLGSTFHTKKKMIALLSTVTAGRRYMMSLVRLPLFRGDAPEVMLQCKLPSCTLSSTSDTKELLQFNADGSRILLGTTEKFFVADVHFETNRMWTTGQGRGNSNFTSVTLHDKFLFALRGRTISIYDSSWTSDERPIATGKLDPTTEKPERIVMFGGRIWFSYILCTKKGILQNLNKLSLDGRGGGRSYVFTVDADHKFSLASSKYRCLFKRGNDLLFLSSGREIRVFDRRGDVSSPFVFSAESSITSMFADNTKLVCATKHPNGRSGRMEVFHLDIFTQTMFASLVVKKTFQSQHTMHSPQLNGRYLSIGYSYDGERAALGAGRFASSYFTVGGEMQVFDLLRLEGK